MTTRTMTARGRVGLTNGRVGWKDEDAVNLSCSYLADRGLHARTIGEITGLTKGQVYYRCKQLGISLRDYRNGLGAASVLVNTFTISNLTQTSRRELRLRAKRPEVEVE